MTHTPAPPRTIFLRPWGKKSLRPVSTRLYLIVEGVMTTTTTTDAATTEFPTLTALGYETKNGRVRLPCSRCHGSGHYSRCERYGTACFDCTASGRPSWTWVPAAPEERKAKRREQARVRRDKKAAKAEAARKAAFDATCAAVLAANPGLGDALKFDHKLSRDLARKFETQGVLSAKQVELAFKVVTDQQARDAEPKAAAPVGQGRVEVVGVVISAKEVDSQYGWSTKLTVKVVTADGYWLAWGTAPRSLLRGLDEDETLRGSTVRFTAALEAGNDEHFAFFKRPTKAVVVEVAG